MFHNQRARESFRKNSIGAVHFICVSRLEQFLGWFVDALSRIPAPSVLLWDPTVRPLWLLIPVRPLALWQRDLFLRNPLPGDNAQ